MINVEDVIDREINIDEYWNFGSSKEYKMHALHAYPAKFPAFIASKAFAYAQNEGVNVNTVSDIFCGCGTVALEAKINGKSFWGCDINPVATLIARAKSATYDVNVLEQYYIKVQDKISSIEVAKNDYSKSNIRIQYWFTEKSFIELYKLKMAIELTVEEPLYKDAFLCLFSSILKSASRWLTKSIKPQVDPDKKDIDIQHAFNLKYKKLINAVNELDDIENAGDIVIENINFLEMKDLPRVDLIITSPPYVTSYEYADLHQLSSLWLDYVDDYRELRKGSIGSVYNSGEFSLDDQELNVVGEKIIENLRQCVKHHSKVRSVARYYVDMQNVVKKCKGMLNDGGMAFFVVGDTEYKGVKILNSHHLVQSLKDNGFKEIKITKRRISNKLLSPYRDSVGKFSADKNARTIYHEEFIISGRV